MDKKKEDKINLVLGILKIKRIVYFDIAPTGQELIASSTHGTSFCALTWAFAPFISKTSSHIEAQVPHPIHASLIFIVIT